MRATVEVCLRCGFATDHSLTGTEACRKLYHEPVRAEKRLKWRIVPYMSKVRWNPRWGREAAGVLFITSEQRPQVLLSLRSAEVLEPGTWGVVGGRVDPGEDTFEAALREALEELGDVPVDGLLVAKYEFVEPDFLYTTFLVQVPRFEVSPEDLNWENDDVQWFRLDQLEGTTKPLHFGVVDLLSNWHKITMLV